MSGESQIGGSKQKYDRNTSYQGISSQVFSFDQIDDNSIQNNLNGLEMLKVKIPKDKVTKTISGFRKGITRGKNPYQRNQR